MSAVPVRIALVGAGLIGRRHAEMVAAHEGAHLAAIVDPAPHAVELAQALGAAHHGSLDAMAAADADAAIIATPNAHHAAAAIACAQHGWPCLVEKPIADTVEAARSMIDAFDGRGLPLLVGHHRRYHAFVERTRELIDGGAIGRPVLLSALWAVRKPDAYFGQGAWRLGPDGGPVMINLIHEIDMMRHLFGEIAQVTGLRSNAQRQGAVEDTSAVTLCFNSGMLASVALTDAAHTPWGFEAASGENPGIARSGQHAWRICGTEGALEFPSLRLWQAPQGTAAEWSKPMDARDIDVPETVPLAAQLDHFLRLARGEDTVPVVGGADALRTLIATREVLDLPLAGNIEAFDAREKPRQAMI